ncbi:G-protein coupled receptor GRL101-like [Dendronephthya gigantea]|uniref:G-protein coupled receptor GRL101-like n=1 Tax=Dendronephthya gigantea TaxID=151771 RepID=UPI00106BF940|nr:G-protein coupled receptor GRL101-like [Dendronephthya gigantea]
MAFLGNFIVIVWRSFSKDSNRVASFLLTNLAVADFLMGVYLLIISYKDTVLNGVYFKHDISWRASNLCIFAGVISTLSSEVSVLTLTVITLERMICIIFTLKFQRWSMKKAWGIMIVVWLIGLCISIIPLLNDAYFYDYKQNSHFFGRSPVCLPLQLSSDRPAGWEYSVFVFLVLNGVSFLFILLAYVFMYRSIVKAARSVRSTRVKKDSTIAKRMMFIILTDFLCWFPVIILSILALTGNLYDPSKQVYAWVAVFVLPINSSINPLLYTFSTPYVRKMIPTSNRLSRLPINYSIKGRFQKGQPKGILADESPVRGLDTIQTAVSSFSTPQAVRRTHLGNVEQLTKKNVGESSFIHDYVEQ